MPTHLTTLAKRHTRKLTALIIGAVIALTAGATAVAYSYVKTSGGDVEQHFATQTAATIIPTASGWHDIPNTSFTVTVPNSNTHHRLAHVTFTAESRCEGASWCSVRAVVTSAETGTTIEMDPASATNFAFDSGGQRGARSFSRIIELSGGGEGIQYTFKLQAQILGGSASSVFRLDDYLTHLELSNTDI
jgi:hypothetical protein